MLPDTKDEKFRYADPREDISKPMLTKSNTDEAASILPFKREDVAACRNGCHLGRNHRVWGRFGELKTNAMETHHILAKRTDLAGHISWG